MNRLRDTDEVAVEVESKVFDDKWSLTLQRYNEGVPRLDQELKIHVNPVLFPLGVFGMEFKLLVKHKKSKEDNDVWIKVHNSKWEDIIHGIGLYLKDIIHDECINLKIEVKISLVYDEEGQIIDRKQWTKYGIL